IQPSLKNRHDSSTAVTQISFVHKIQIAACLSFECEVAEPLFANGIQQCVLSLLSQDQRVSSGLGICVEPIDRHRERATDTAKLSANAYDTSSKFLSAGRSLAEGP